MPQSRAWSWPWLWSCVLSGTIFLTRSQSTTNCSAVNSYVEVVSPSNLSSVLTSSHALFSQYAYHVAVTQVVLLNASTDDVCNNNTIRTDIADNIVLMFGVDAANCSNPQKLFAAQSHGAKAVLLVNDLLSGEVATIANDDTGNLNLYIPMRSISHIDGAQLRNAILAGTIVTIQFGCYTADEYPSQLCLLDTAGDIFWVDGDYQRQPASTMNGHPVWKKTGYASALVFPDFHLYLHRDWRWSVTFDATLQDEEQIVAQCADVEHIASPLQCTAWNISVFDDVNGGWRFEDYAHLQLSEGLCTLADAVVCVHSQQSHLRGVGGTYVQFSAAVPVWFRRLHACDGRVGVLEFSAPYYVLYDVLLGWTVAVCEVDADDAGDDDTQPLWLRVPPSECTDWWSLHNDSLQPFDFEADATLTIAMDTDCDTANDCVVSTAPDQLCMAKSSVMHGFLEGDYMASSEVVGPRFGTREYTRAQQLYHDGEHIAVYLWFLGEVDEFMPWWVIADIDLAEMLAQSLSAADVYPLAYCEANTSNPIDCGQHWNFDVPLVYYDGVALQTAHTYHSDAFFELYAGVCDTAPAEETRSWPSHICVQVDELAAVADLSSTDPFESLYVGGYVLNETTTPTTDDGFPHWVKPAAAADPLQREVFLYFDAFWGWWQIGLALHGDRGVLLICFQEQDYSPVDCTDWYDTNTLARAQHLRFYACSESEALGGDAEGESAASVVVPVVVVLMVCGCFALFWYCWHQRLAQIDFRNRNEERGKTNELPDMMQQQPPQAHEEEEDGGRLERSDSNAGLTANAALTKTDFRPLTTEDTLVSETQNDEHVAHEPVPEPEDTHENENELQIGDDIDDDDDEKKEEVGQGSLDVRRMSAAKLDKMQKEMDDWTQAMIEDPVDAARRYSRGAQAKQMPTDLIDSLLSDPPPQYEKETEAVKANQDQPEESIGSSASQQDE